MLREKSDCRLVNGIMSEKPALEMGVGALESLITVVNTHLKLLFDAGIFAIILLTFRYSIGKVIFVLWSILLSLGGAPLRNEGSYIAGWVVFEA